MQDKKLIEKLKDIGFKEYEAKVLLVLLKGIPMSASEIAKEANLIRNSIYDTLKSFAEKGYCNEIETTTVLKYQIIDPELIGDKFKNDYNKHVKTRISSITETFDEVSTLFKKVKVEKKEPDVVQLLRGFNKRRPDKYVEFFNNSKFEILALSTIRGLVTDEINDFTRNFVMCGGKIKSIYRVGLDFKVMKNDKPVNAEHEDLINVCKMFESFGEEVRLTDISIPNLIISDRERVFLNIAGKKSRKDQTDIIINDSAYAKNMIDLFNQYWVNSQTIGEFQHGNKL